MVRQLAGDQRPVGQTVEVWPDLALRPADAGNSVAAPAADPLDHRTAVSGIRHRHEVTLVGRRFASGEQARCHQNGEQAGGQMNCNSVRNLLPFAAAALMAGCSAAMSTSPAYFREEGRGTAV